MKIERLKRYQRDPLYREAWMWYQDQCRVYGDEVPLAGKVSMAWWWRIEWIKYNVRESHFAKYLLKNIYK
jgi:hypothetical protein